MPVSVFKEKIANEIGVPVGQQRLIFRGRVLKDEHLLSEYRIQSYVLKICCVSRNFFARTLGLLFTGEFCDMQVNCILSILCINALSYGSRL